MKIVIKNFKPVLSMSEETIAFTGTLYLDGKKCGFVSNRGTGGPNDFTDRDAESQVNEWCKTQPDVEGLALDADYKIGIIVDEMLTAKQNKQEISRMVRKLRKRLVHPDHMVRNPFLVVGLNDTQTSGKYVKVGTSPAEVAAELTAQGFTTVQVFNSTTGKPV